MENANVVVVKFAMQVPCVEDSPQAEGKKWEYLICLFLPQSLMEG